MTKTLRSIPLPFAQTMEREAFEDSHVGCYTAWAMFGEKSSSPADQRTHLENLFLSEEVQMVMGHRLTDSILELPLAFIDIESTGRYAATDRILEIFALKSAKIDGSSKRARSEYHMFVDPGVNFYNTSIHGITPKMVKGKPGFAEIADQLCDELRNHVIIAHNASRFDWLILRAELHRAGIFDFEPLAIIDTLDVARKTWPKLPSYSLVNLCKSLNIKQESAHHAKVDVMTLCRLFAKVMEKRPNVSIGEICKFI